MWISSCSFLANEVATENHRVKFRSCVSVNLQCIEPTALLAHSWVRVEFEAECNDGLRKADRSIQRGNLLSHQPLLPTKQGNLLEPSTFLWCCKKAKDKPSVISVHCNSLSKGHDRYKDENRLVMITLHDVGRHKFHSSIFLLEQSLMHWAHDHFQSCYMNATPFKSSNSNRMQGGSYVCLGRTDHAES